MNRHTGVRALLILMVALFFLAACDTQAGTSSTSSENFLLEIPTETSTPSSCAACPQATLSALQTQERSNADAQAAATAAIMRANAQATLNASGATLSAALTQEQNNVNIVAAQVEATAAIVRANAQATLAAAVSTQNAAFTQDAIRQTQVQYNLQVTADLATQNAIAQVTQQNNNLLAGSTRTAVAEHIATQTQSAIATSQWYADQARQRAEQRQEPLTFLWLWCPPFLIVAAALVGLGFFWRWMKIRENQQLIEMRPETVLLINPDPPQPANVAPYSQYQLARPRDNVRRWLEEVKRKVITNEKDDNDNPGS